MSCFSKILPIMLTASFTFSLSGQTAQSRKTPGSEYMEATTKPLLTKIVVIRGPSKRNPDWWSNRCQIGTLDLESIRGVMNDLGLIVEAGTGPTPSSYRETSREYPLLADLNKLWVDEIAYRPSDMPGLIKELDRALIASRTEDERHALKQFRDYALTQEHDGHGLVLL